MWAEQLLRSANGHKMDVYMICTMLFMNKHDTIRNIFIGSKTICDTCCGRLRPSIRYMHSVSNTTCREASKTSTKPSRAARFSDKYCNFNLITYIKYTFQCICKTAKTMSDRRLAASKLQNARYTIIFAPM